MMKQRNLAVACAALVLACAAAYGQVGNGSDKKDDAKADPVTGLDLGTERNAVDVAKNLGKAGDVVGAEAAVSLVNRAKKNTAEWSIETAQRLMQTAEVLAREGKATQVTALANRAVDNLSQVEKQSKDAATRAAAKALAGFIQERYLADTIGAIANYEAAAQLAPTEAKGAKDAAERLKKSEDNQKDKTPDKLKEKIDPSDKKGGGHG